MAQKHSDDLTEVKLRTLDGKDLSYKVFVTTFLGFGANEARRRYLDWLSKKNVTAIDDDNSKASSNLTDHCLPKGLVLKEHGQSVVGTGNFDTCLASLSPLLNKEKACPDTPCYFNGAHVPLKNLSIHKFLGVSEFWYSSYDVFNLGGPYNFSSLLQASRDFCGSDWTTITSNHSKGAFPNVQEQSRLEAQCFKSAWLLNFLHEGFGFPKDSLPGNESSSKHNVNPHFSFESVNSISNFSVSWTLGAMLVHVSESLDSSSNFLFRPQVHRWVAFWLLLSICATFCCLFFSRSKKKEGYRKVFPPPMMGQI